MYANKLGRFTTVDPIFIKRTRIIDPQKLNLYVYARNAPFKYVDISGADIVLASELNEKGREKDRAYAVKHLARYYMTDQGKKTLERLDSSNFVIEFTVTKSGKIKSKVIDTTSSSGGTTFKSGETTETHKLGRTDYSSLKIDGDIWLQTQRVGEKNSSPPIRASIDSDKTEASGTDPAKVIAHELEGHTGKLVEEATKESPDVPGYPLGKITNYKQGDETYPLEAEKAVNEQLKKIKDPTQSAIDAVEKIVKPREK